MTPGLRLVEKYGATESAEQEGVALRVMKRRMMEATKIAAAAVQAARRARIDTVKFSSDLQRTVAKEWGRSWLNEAMKSEPAPLPSKAPLTKRPKPSEHSPSKAPLTPERGKSLRLSETTPGQSITSFNDVFTVVVVAWAVHLLPGGSERLQQRLFDRE